MLKVFVELFDAPQRFNLVTVIFVAGVARSIVTTLLLAFVIQTTVMLVPGPGAVPPLQFVPTCHRPLLGLVQTLSAYTLVLARKMETRPAIAIKCRKAFLFMIAGILAEFFVKASLSFEKYFSFFRQGGGQSAESQAAGTSPS